MRPGGPQAPHHLTGQARQLLRSPVRAKGREWGAGPEWGQLRFKKAYCRAATSAQTQKQAGCPATGDPGSLQSPYHPYSQRMLSDVGTEDNSRPSALTHSSSSKLQNSFNKDGCHPALQLGQPQHTAVKELVQGHTASEGGSPEENQASRSTVYSLSRSGNTCDVQGRRDWRTQHRV